MQRTLNIRVSVRPLPLSPSAVVALKHCRRYDMIVFTSKHAQRIFLDELKRRRIRPPTHIVRVGPRNELLKLTVRGKKILFPRSALAPHDIVVRLRQKGATVHTLPLYTAFVPPLSHATRIRLMSSIDVLAFRSPSGIYGVLSQLRGKARAHVLGLTADCIGTTTAAAARKMGFKKVLVRGV